MGADGKPLSGRTAYNSWHVNGFKAQADRLKKEYGFESHQIFTGQQIIENLKQTTKAHGQISFVAIFSHGGIADNPDKSQTSGLFSSVNKGFYHNSVDQSSRLPGYATVGDIKKSMNEGTVKFSSDVIIFIDGCNATIYPPDFVSKVNLAQQLVMETGVTVIAASSHAAMVDEKKYDGRFKIVDGEIGSFYRLSREAYTEEEEIPNHLQGSYGGDSPTIKVTTQKYRIKFEDLGRETKIDNYIKK